MKFIDFFSGIGGFRDGMQQAGHQCVGFCEFDKFAVASYVSMHCITEEQRKHLETFDFKKRQKEILKEEYRNGEWYANDIRTVDAGSLPRADCWCFGFPCQDISVAGKQLGFNGHRSSLFFAVTKLIRELKEEDRPKYLFIENVKNLLSVNAGFDFAKLLIELDEIGYDAEWQVLNSKDFGVPQNRERCFIIGHLRGRSSSEVFPITGTDEKNRVSVIGHRDGYRQNTLIFDPNGISETLQTCAGGGREPHTIKVIGNVNPSGLGMNGNVYSSFGKSPSLTTNKGEGNKIAIPVLTPERTEKRQNGRRFKENGEPSFTLTGQDRHGVAINLIPLGILRTVRSDYGKRIRKDYESGKLKISRHDFLQYDIRTDGIANTLSTVEKDNYLSAMVKEATKSGYAECRVGGVDSVNLDRPDSTTRRGRVGIECANTLDCKYNQGIFVEVDGAFKVYAIWSEKYQCYIAVRRLTPKECFRLQGWADDYFEKAQFVNSDSQLYKQAGNGVTVNVIKAIAEKMR